MYYGEAKHYLFLSLKILTGVDFTNSYFYPHCILFPPNTFFSLSLSLLICSLGLSPASHTPWYILPVLISHKYSADLIFDHH